MIVTVSASDPAGVRISPAYLACKRAFDIVASVAGILLLLPFLPLVALLIKLDSEGPVFFWQDRLGRNGRIFRICKLRTMTHNAPEIRNPDGSRYVGRNDARLTRVGRILRDYSIDELPQLINVLKGEMSIVGPRPDQPGPGLDGEIFRRKRLVKPGLTSLASVKGRNSLPWRERVVLELEYVENASLKLDFAILLKTVQVVCRRDGIYYSDPAHGEMN